MINTCAVIILILRTDRSGKTIYTQIRLKEQSAQGLHCLPLHLHLFDTLFFGNITLIKFKDNDSIFLFECPMIFSDYCGITWVRLFHWNSIWLGVRNLDRNFDFDRYWNYIP